ncbi:hypothetical protein D3C76_1550200 [compost metagenome]
MPIQITMRVDIRKLSLIDAAAELRGTDRTSFILDAACRRAEEVITDRQLFLLSDDAIDRFEQGLKQNALKDNKCLQKLLYKPTLWS